MCFVLKFDLSDSARGKFILYIPPTPLIIIIGRKRLQIKNKRYLTIGLTREGQ